MIHKIIEIPITEASFLAKLSSETRRLYYYLLDSFESSRKDIFLLSSIQQWSGFDSWRDVLSSLYELESRGLGEVIDKGPDTTFRLRPL